MFRLRDKSITLRKPEKFSDSGKRTGSGPADTKKEVLCLNPPTDMTEIVLHNPGACCSRTASQQRVKPFKRRGGTAGGSGAGTVTAAARRASRAPIKPIQRNAANARERSRMRVLSKAFGRLKTSLPWVPPDTKLSKLDTLRLASSYISHLKKLLEDDTLDGTLVHPLNLTWPFAISSRPITTDDTSEDNDKETRSDTASDVMSESP